MTIVNTVYIADAPETPSREVDLWHDLFNDLGLDRSRFSSSSGVTDKGVTPEVEVTREKKRALPDPSHHLYPELKTAAKKNKDRHRKQLRFPVLRRVYAKKRERTDGTVIQAGRSYQGDVWDYLVTVGLRMQWDRHDSDKRLHTADELASLFLEVTTTKAITWDTWDDDEIGISLDYLPTFTIKAAETVIRDRDEEYRRKAAVRGRIGGMRSKRPPVYMVAMLDPLQGLTAAQQADVLGCHIRTIRRLRAEQNAIRTDS